MIESADRFQPRGLYVIAATEAWERFSYYGMSALVMLYMVQSLFQPGSIGSVYGLGILRHALEAIYGPLSNQALASQLFGFYAGLVYLTPLIGGFLADRLIGIRMAVVAGLVLLACGHLMMTFDETFLVALGCLVCGSGLVKGNLSAQLGKLYPDSDQTRRTRGFTLLAMTVNLGAMGGPLICGAVAESHGWHAAFGIAAALMAIGLATYLGGMRTLPRDLERKCAHHRNSLSRTDRATVLILIAVMIVALFQAIVYSQLFNVGIVWIEDHVERHTSLGSIPTPWFNSIDALASVISAPLLILLWRIQASRAKEPDFLHKIAIGAALTLLQVLLLALASSLAGPDKVNAFVVVLVLVGAGIAFNYHWPPLIALLSIAAPSAVNAMMINSAFLIFFVGNVIAGQLGILYEPLGPAAFWMLNAAVAATGLILTLTLREIVLRKRWPVLCPLGDDQPVHRR